MATKTKKIKNLFPKLTRGGYTARFRFTDESRGERFFDAEWDICDYKTPGQFVINRPINYRGEICYNDLGSWFTIGAAIRRGDQISVHVTRWNMRGRHGAGGRLITITGIYQGDAGTTVVTYE